MPTISVPDYSVSDPAVLPFIVIPLLLVCAFVWGTAVGWRRAGRVGAARAALVAGLAACAWMGATWIAAASGVLREWDRTPPPFALFVIALAALATAIAFSPLGTTLARLPLWALVGVQVFRLPLELAMHEMYAHGIMPIQMSYSGLNFDIVTGATAVPVAAAAAAGWGGRGLTAAWNVLGLVLLLNVVTVAILSTPRLRYFGDEQLNVWVTYPPFVWLPAVMVLAALTGHLLIFRALAAGPASRH